MADTDRTEDHPDNITILAKIKIKHDEACALRSPARNFVFNRGYEKLFMEVLAEENDKVALERKIRVRIAELQQAEREGKCLEREEKRKRASEREAAIARKRQIDRMNDITSSRMIYYEIFSIAQTIARERFACSLADIQVDRNLAQANVRLHSVVESLIERYITTRSNTYSSHP